MAEEPEVDLTASVVEEDDADDADELADDEADE
jgi:hypothetical protein